jgi:hypothetical protein
MTAGDFEPEPDVTETAETTAVHRRLRRNGDAVGELLAGHRTHPARKYYP